MYLLYAQTENIPHLFWRYNIVQHFWLMFEIFVIENCALYGANMKLKEDCVLFGNAKDFESDEIFGFIILFANLFIYVNVRWKTNTLFYIFIKIF